MAEEGGDFGAFRRVESVSGLCRLDAGRRESVKSSFAIGGQFEGAKAREGLGLVGDLEDGDVFALFEFERRLRNIGARDAMQPRREGLAVLADEAELEAGQIADMGYDGFVAQEYTPSPGRNPLISLAVGYDILTV